MTSKKIAEFSRPLTLLVQLRPKFFHPPEFRRPISNESHSRNDKQSVKRKHHPRITFICYQVFLISTHYFCLGFPLTSFHLAEANVTHTAIFLKNLLIAFLL